MTFFQSVVLGIIQGASEFLPISSSGHLVIAPYLFGWKFSVQEAFIFDVLVQVATLVAVIIYFWKDLIEIVKSMIGGIKERELFKDVKSRLGWFLVLATIPAGITAILFKDTFEQAFSNPKAASIFLLFTSILLILGELLGSRERLLKSLTWIDAIWIGFFQVLALFPGISRSGSTITGGLLRGLDRSSAARFSFLMSIPVMTAAGVLALYDLFTAPELIYQLPVYLVGFISAAIVGYLAIRWFISYLSKRSLYIFAIYCALLGVGFLIATSYF
jgi:undecaprenyl-diphosphatase